MGKKGKSLHVSRFHAPKFWMQPPKQKYWAPKPSPGPHPKDKCIPLLIVLRDMLKVADIADEVRKILSLGYVVINGRTIKDRKFPIGMFDIIEIPKINKKWIIIPTPKYLLRPKEIEETIYIGRISQKKMVKGGKILLGLHNGHNIVLPSEEGRKFKRMDSIVYNGTKIIKHLPLKEGMLAIITEGRRSGLIGRIKKIERGSMIRRAHTTLEVDGAAIEVPSDYIFVIGENEPEVKVR